MMMSVITALANYFVVIIVGGQDHPHPIQYLLNCFSVQTPLKVLLSAERFMNVFGIF